MNQAAIRRLPRCALLLLAPLLVASTPSPFAFTQHLVLAQTQPTLSFTGLPLLFVSGVCTGVMLELRQGQQRVPATDSFVVELTGDLHGGQFYSSSACSSPITTLTFPQGAETQQVWFRASLIGAVTLRVIAPLLSIPSDPIPARAGPAEHLTLQPRITQTPAGAELSVTVVALDSSLNVATEYTGEVHFTASDPSASLPADYRFTANDLGQRPFLLRLFRAGLVTLEVQDVNNARLKSEPLSIQVFPGSFDKIRLESFTLNPVGTCREATLELRALDAYGNTVRDGRLVTLCEESPRRAVPTEYSELESPTATNDCVTGVLNADIGVARLRWRSDSDETVSFKVSYVHNGASVQSLPVNVTWKAGMPDADRSKLEFDKPGSPPTLKTVIERLTLRLDLRDACGAPIPSDTVFTLAGEGPLDIGTPRHESGSLWRADVRLPECPTDETEPLYLWPVYNGAEIVSPSNGRLEQHVQPLCADVQVTLTARPKDKDTVAEAGEELEFLAELHNEGQELIRSGLLKMKPSQMSLLEVKLDGGDELPVREESFEMPDLRPSETLTVKVKAQASAQLDQPASAEVWFTTADGIKLTPVQTVTFERGDVSVDVGCGCQAGGLSGQLLAWMALLLAVSRPWERLRRLRRNERIDPQAPWR